MRIRDKWASLGWERSVLGYPVTDQALTLDGRGEYNHFQGGSIYASPFTNTIAIRRLGLKPKEVQTIRACFVSLPDLQVSAVPQRYTLQNLNDLGAMYLYEGLTSGFKTDLPIDQNGFVIDYPQFFRRIL